jgi:FtsP/CotA-like multicopper oxidase with cupredoxin domain
MMAGDDGSAMPVYDFSTINGKALGFGEPLRVKRGERVLVHLLNSSPTEVHWVALAGHRFQVIALDGNAVGRQQTVEMLRLGPAERVSAIVEMDAPGMWTQPKTLIWDYRQFADAPDAAVSGAEVVRIPLTFASKFRGHGSEEEWTINGRSYPHTDEPLLTLGTRYRLVMKNLSTDMHPIHLHRHVFEVRRVDGGPEMSGLRKDVLLVPAKSTAEVEFTASQPGRTLLHCHQQDHMDRGFMMVFRGGIYTGAGSRRA